MMGELDVQPPAPPRPADQLKLASKQKEDKENKKKCKAKAKACSKAKAHSKAKSKANKKLCAAGEAAEEAPGDEAPRSSLQVKAKAKCSQGKVKKAKVEVGAPPPAGVAAESAAAVPKRPGVAQVSVNKVKGVRL